LQLDAEKRIEMYRVMVLTRLFEARFVELFEKGCVGEEPYVGVGQEAVGVGACSALEDDDLVLPSLRGRSQFLARGASLRRLAATIYGRATGYAEARMTSDHIADSEHGIIAGVGVVGSGISIAVGVAYASLLMGDRRVTMVFFGDGATNTGAFHEALNFAGAMHVPVVFVCENNQYALSTPIGRATAVDILSRRAEAYGIPGTTVDGNDILEVFGVCNEAVARARSGEGPSLIECVTYRINSHCPSIPDTRDPDEILKWKARCPIQLFERSLVAEGVLSRNRRVQLWREAEAEVRDAFDWAEQCPPPLPERGCCHVYWSKGDDHVQ
jgi:pyruvate dehydrogenase E1 component alpha subunit